MIDPEIFINQKNILKPYVPTAEPMAAMFYATRKIKQFDIQVILKREIDRAELLFQKNVLSGLTADDIEKAKINFALPKNLFHCLLLNTAPGKLSFNKRLIFIIELYEKLMLQYNSFYNREIIRENFINGVSETMLLLYTSTYQLDSALINNKNEEFSLLFTSNERESRDGQINDDYPIKEQKAISMKELFIDKSFYPIVIKRMIDLNVLDANHKLKSIRGNKSKLNLLILELHRSKVIKIDGLSDKDLTHLLKNEFGDCSNDKFFSELKSKFNGSENLSINCIRFLEQINDICK